MKNSIGRPRMPRPNLDALSAEERLYASGRLWSKTSRSEAGCWEWQGNKFRNYGRVNVWGGKMWAHRLSWLLAHGSLPRHLNVLHKCDNPPCVRPDHLFIGTHSDNVADMVAKGRNSCQDMRGEGNPRARLYEEDVRCARVQHTTNGVSSARIAASYGVTYQHAYKMLHGRSWRHVEGACSVPCPSHAAMLAAIEARKGR